MTRPSSAIPALVLAALANAAGAVTLVSGGTPQAAIVTPDSPSEAESLAAERLQHYVRTITGAGLEIVPEAKAPNGTKVFVGRTKAGAAVRADLEAQQPPDESSVVKVTSDAVFLVGIDDPGTVHATYFLLESLGCRWYLPAEWGTVVPRKQDIVIPEGTQLHAPDFPMRAGLSRCGLRLDEDPEWGGHEWGRGNHLGGWRWWGAGHSYQYLVPEGKYFKEHPEYFAEINGERKTSQLCVTNPGVAETAIRTVRGALAKPSAPKLVSISPKDGHGFCQCANCRGLIPDPVPDTVRRIERVPTGAGPLPVARTLSVDRSGVADQIVHLANCVARGIRDDHPDRWVVFYADYHSVGVPVAVRPEPNLGFWIVQWAQDQFHGVSDETKMGKAILNWSVFGNPIVVYTYYGSYASFSLWPQVHAIRRDIPWYRRHGVVGLYSETHQHWGTQHLNFIVFPRLLWDADTDVDALVDEFCTLFYGPAAKSMRAYYDLLEATAEKGPPQYHMNSDIIATFSPQVLEQLEGLIKQAQTAVEGKDALYRKRVDFAAKGFSVAWLYLTANHLKTEYAKERRPETREEIIRRYRELQALIQAPENANRLVESRIAEPVVKRELAAVERGTTFPLGTFTYHDGFERGGKSALDAVKKRGFVDGVWGLDLRAGGAAEIVFEMKADGGVFGQVSISSLILHAFGRVEVGVGDSLDGPLTEVAAADSPDAATQANLGPPIELTEHVRGKRAFHLRLGASNRHGKYINCIDTFALTGEVVEE